MRSALVALVLLVLAALGIYVAAGRSAPPAIAVAAPSAFVGAGTAVDVTVGAPKADTIQIAFEQNGASTPVCEFSPDSHGPAAAGDRIEPSGADRDHVVCALPASGLKAGAATVVITASRPVLHGVRRVSSMARRDVQVRLEKPRVSVVSTKHYVNLGGSEMIVYRVSPADVASGVRVGDLEYPGYPASGASVEGLPALSDPGLRIAFFALRYDQPLDTPMHLYARDGAGNTATAEFDHRAFPKPFKKSNITLDDKFLDRVVPAILAGTHEIAPQGSTLDQFLAINGELRRKNAETIASMTSKTSPEMLWRGVVFHPFTNSKVEAAFADFRTYFYQGKAVDHQVHLGFDLASFTHAPVVAANRGKVVYAAELGIYGNCVIIDHGMGVQSLYGHLSAIAVKVGDMVDKEQRIGTSGMTGLAAGDHLHFTMLVAGQMVNPIEWWDPHWIQDRVLRKLREAR